MVTIPEMQPSITAVSVIMLPPFWSGIYVYNHMYTCVFMCLYIYINTCVTDVIMCRLYKCMYKMYTHTHTHTHLQSSEVVTRMEGNDQTFSIYAMLHPISQSMLFYI